MLKLLFLYGLVALVYWLLGSTLVREYHRYNAGFPDGWDAVMSLAQ